MIFLNFTYHNMILIITQKLFPSSILIKLYFRKWKCLFLFKGDWKLYYKVHNTKALLERKLYVLVQFLLLLIWDEITCFIINVTFFISKYYTFCHCDEFLLLEEMLNLFLSQGIDLQWISDLQVVPFYHNILEKEG